MPKEDRKGFRPFGDMFKLLGNLAGLIDDAIEEGDEINRTGEIRNLLGVKGLKARYGYSVKVGISENPFEEETERCRPKRENQAIERQEKTSFLIDVFDEKEYVRVLVWLPGIGGEDIEVDVKGKTLTLYVNLPDGQHREEIELPDWVGLEETSAVYHEGILQVTLKKSVANLSRQRRKMAGGEQA